MLHASDLSRLDGIRHAFFTRNGGVSDHVYDSLNIGLGSDDARENVLENRRRVARALGVKTSHLLFAHQHHSADVVSVNDVWETGDSPKADAMVTNQPGVALAVATADCGPVLFADAQARVIGAAHSGWRGALEGVLENTMTAMEKLGAKRENIVAALGPTISGSAYEVGPEFARRFTERDARFKCYFKPSKTDGHMMFDLPRFITDQLRHAGAGSVSHLGHCTYQDESRFYSYRRGTHRKEQDYGRLASAVALSEQ